MREEERRGRREPPSKARRAGLIRSSVEFPKEAVKTLESNEHVEAVEVDGEMKTQKKD